MTLPVVAKQPMVPLWRPLLGEEEAALARKAILSGMVSQGEVTRRFERRLGELLGVPYVVATPSCSMALYLALAVLDIGPGDEVILPNRTFIAAAHAVLLRGASIRLVDTHKNDTLIDEAQIEAAITPRTRAIIPTHLNGNAAETAAIVALARKRGIRVIEDAAQALASRDGKAYLGTQADLGCFSLGPTKLVTTGQGGFVVTKDEALYRKMLRFRNQGVDDILTGDFQQLGFNLKFNDVLAAIGLAQLDRLEAKIAAQLKAYRFYEKALAGFDFLRLIPVDLDRGCVPLWIEVLTPERDRFLSLIREEGIQVRAFTGDLNRSVHLANDAKPFKNSSLFSDHGVWLPCGPGLPDSAYERTLDALKSIAPKIKGRVAFPR